jgi:hypothetical protein
MLLVFLGLFLVVSGIYEEKLQHLQNSVKTEYKFVPRTQYQESIVSADLKSLYRPTFIAEDPWNQLSPKFQEWA